VKNQEKKIGNSCSSAAGKGKNMKFPNWTSKPGQFSLKREEIAARNTSHEEYASIANNAEEALIVTYIFLYGLVKGPVGFTEEEVQEQLERNKNYEEMVLTIFDMIRMISKKEKNNDI